MAEKLATLVIDIEGRIDKLESSMKRAENRSQKATTKISTMFKRMGTTLSATFGGLFLFNELRKGVKAFIELDKGMRLVNTITKVTDAQLESLKTQVIALSTELGTPTSQMTGAMYQAVSAGVAYNDVMEFMKVATKGAVAGNADVETSVDALTTVMNSWGIQMSEVNDVADIMFKTIELGKTNMSELAASYALVAPLAAASGVSFEELSAAIGVLTAAGTPTSQAMTQLSAVIVSLKKELGEGIFQQNSFTDALNIGREAYIASGKTLTEFLGRKEAELAMLGLTGAKANDVALATEKMGDRSGAAANAFDEMSKSISKNIQNLVVLIENKLIVAFDTILTKITSMVNLVKDNPALQTLLKLGVAPLFLSEGSQISAEKYAEIAELLKKGTDEMRSGRDMWDAINMRTREAKIETSLLVNELEEQVHAVKDIFDEQKRLNDLNESGLLTIKEFRENEAEIVRLGKLLTGEVEKQVEGSRILADNYVKIKESLAFAAGTGGVTSTAAGVGGEGVSPAFPIIGPREMETANEVELAFEAMEASANNIDQKFISILNAGASLSSILNIGAHTFVGVLLDGLNKANSIANSIFGIISAFAGGGGGGILGFLFPGGAGKGLEGGGSFRNGNILQGYATGGSGIVPQGFPSDSFLLPVTSGEQVDITPTHKVGDNVKVLAGIKTAIDNMNESVVSGTGGTIRIPVSLDGKQIFEIVQEHSNRASRAGINLDEF
ncbi:MAG TPA: phage tail tape measure protein [bacterium]|nr:phage tail tape measure protein [bacterium]